MPAVDAGTSEDASAQTATPSLLASELNAQKGPQKGSLNTSPYTSSGSGMLEPSDAAAFEGELSSALEAPLQLTWWLTFPDLATERQFRDRYLKPHLEKAFFRVTCIVTGGMFVQLGAQVFFDVSQGIRFGAFFYNACLFLAFSIASSLAASRFMRRSYPLRATENLACLYFLVLDAEVALSARPALMRKLFTPAVPSLGEPTARELESDLRLTWSTQSMLLRCVLVAAFITSFGPMQLPQYIPAMGAISLFAIVAAIVDPLPEAPNAPGMVFVDWSFLLLTSAILAFVRVQAILVERRAFHLQRDVLSRARTEIADKVRRGGARAGALARRGSSRHG